ncbi:hypothetical protein HMPREF1573_01256 [Gardnerella vaginalis JCP7276]|nr:hypothetical protein HMPREF1573_01256 [Gardnerella vaginalis JCP7276]
MRDDLPERFYVVRLYQKHRNQVQSHYIAGACGQRASEPQDVVVFATRRSRKTLHLLHKTILLLAINQ